MLHAEICPWFADTANYLAASIISYDLTFQQKKRFFAKVKQHDQIIRRCVRESEMSEIIKHCLSLECGGQFHGQRKTAKGCNQASIAHLSSRMLTLLRNHVIGVKGQATLEEEMRAFD